MYNKNQIFQKGFRLVQHRCSQVKKMRYKEKLDYTDEIKHGYPSIKSFRGSKDLINTQQPNKKIKEEKE